MAVLDPDADWDDSQNGINCSQANFHSAKQFYPTLSVTKTLPTLAGVNWGFYKLKQPHIQ